MTTRRDFMQTIAGAAVFATPGMMMSADAKTPAATTSEIKRGLTICYSFSREIRSKQMTLQDAIAEASDIGAYGLELLPEMVVPNFPNPPDSFVAQWFAWMDEYKTVPVTYTQFLDANITSGRVIAAVSIAGAALRLNKKRVSLLVPLVARTASDFSGSLGYRPGGFVSPGRQS